MHTVHTVKAAYAKPRHGAHTGKSMVRFQIDDNVVFSQRYELTNPDLLDAIPEGADVFIGVQALGDGTYWMHWLHAPGYGTVQPLPLRLSLTIGIALWTIGLCLCLLVAKLIAYWVADVLTVASMPLNMVYFGGFFSPVCTLSYAMYWEVS